MHASGNLSSVAVDVILSIIHRAHSVKFPRNEKDIGLPFSLSPCRAREECPAPPEQLLNTILAIRPRKKLFVSCNPTLTLVFTQKKSLP